MKEIKQTEDVQPLNLFFEYYSQAFKSEHLGEVKTYEALLRKVIKAIPVEEVAQMINLAMDAEAYGAQYGNFEDAHKWRKLSEDLIKNEVNPQVRETTPEQ